MSSLKLYVVKDNSTLIGGLNTTKQVDPGSLPFVFQDTVTLQVYVMELLQTQDPSLFPYDIVPTNGLALLMEFTDGKLDADRTVYASQYFWATDPNNQFFTADVSFSTSAMEALLEASEPNDASVYLKIAYVQGGKQVDIFSSKVNIGIGVGTPTITPVPNQTVMTAEVARQTFVPLQSVAGQGIELQSVNGKKVLLVYVDQPDGSASFQTLPLN